MKTHDRAPVDATPDQVWPFVADPDRIPLWNPKLVSIDHRGAGPVSTGDRFTAAYRMSPDKAPVKSSVRVLRAEAPRLVEYEHVVDDPRQRMTVVETYRIASRGDRTWVHQSVDLSAALPWWIKPLVWWLARFGKPVGRTTMEELAHVVQTGGTPRRRLPSAPESS